jgi:HPt (histidine-containing phosphotransfer) domain-containing protein
LSGLLVRCSESLAQYLADINKYATDGDFSEVRRAAHDLKSICAQFGAVRASEIARSIEVDLADIEAVKAVLGELSHCVTEAAAAIYAIQTELAAQDQSGRSAA